MNKKTYLFFPLMIVSICSMAQKKINMDSIIREAAKTEVYSPVPPIVTHGKTPLDAQV